MNPIKMFKLWRDYDKAKSISEEKVNMNVKITQWATLIVSVIAMLGLPDIAQQWMSHHPTAYAVIGAVAVIIGHLFPKLPTGPNGASDTAKKAGLILLAAALLCPPLHAQAIPEAPAPTQVQNLYAGGMSYSVGGSPAIAGTALYAHSLSDGTYAFTAIDALPNTIRPFTVSTNIGAGVAQKIATIANIPIYVPTAAGISWSGSNTGWQWSGGVLASIHVKGPYYILPSVRFLKSSVSGGTGYQPILGILFGWGK